MASHHFIGTGPYSQRLGSLTPDPEVLLATIADQVSAAGFEVVLRTSAAFPHGGLTLVCVLAESHLVLHYWGEEGFVTIDLHICDYRDCNAAKAEALVATLEDFCFLPGTAEWQRIALADPRVPA